MDFESMIIIVVLGIAMGILDNRSLRLMGASLHLGQVPRIPWTV
jgi:hypothetical protein